MERIAILGSGVGSAVILFTLRRWLKFRGDVDIYALSRVDKVFPFVNVEPDDDFSGLELVPRVEWDVRWECTVEEYNRKRWGDLFPLIGVPEFVKYYPRGKHVAFSTPALYAWIMGKYDPNWILIPSPLSQEEIVELCGQYDLVFQTFPKTRKPGEFLESYIRIDATTEYALLRYPPPDDPGCRVHSFRYDYTEFPVGIKPQPWHRTEATLKVMLLHPEAKPISPQDPEISNLYYVGRYALKNVTFKVQHIVKLIQSIMEGTR